MFQNFDEIQKLGKENADLAVKSVSAVTKGVQAIAVEMVDYSKKSFEQGSAAAEKLLGAKSLDKAMEIQTDYVKAAYEGMISQATKLGALYTDLAKEAYKPYENVLGKLTPKA
ncbi:MAG: phasin family protein [Methylacidiphilales bacterium]|nr:phasin family protein [Candidatus Methylacidiphilales bacterium]